MPDSVRSFPRRNGYADVNRATYTAFAETGTAQKQVQGRIRRVYMKRSAETGTRHLFQSAEMGTPREPEGNFQAVCRLNPAKNRISGPSGAGVLAETGTRGVHRLWTTL